MLLVGHRDVGGLQGSPVRRALGQGAGVYSRGAARRPLGGQGQSAPSIGRPRRAGSAWKGRRRRARGHSYRRHHAGKRLPGRARGRRQAQRPTPRVLASGAGPTWRIASSAPATTSVRESRSGAEPRSAVHLAEHSRGAPKRRSCEESLPMKIHTVTIGPSQTRAPDSRVDEQEKVSREEPGMDNRKVERTNPKK
jgi:hypothetical protein